MRIAKRKHALKRSATTAEVLARIAKSDPEFSQHLAEPAVEAGRLVRDARHAAGMTQEQLARATGLPQPAISDIERGAGIDGPTFRKLRTIGKPLGLTVGFIPLSESSSEDLPSTAIDDAHKHEEKNELLVAMESADAMAPFWDYLSLQGGYQVKLVNTAEDALGAAGVQPFAAIVLDIGLPDMDGLQVCNNLRVLGFQAPIIMMCGADANAESILGEGIGADDYVTKPFKAKTLLARIRAHIHRQSAGRDSPLIAIDRFMLHSDMKRLVDLNTHQSVGLTESELSILEYLSHPQRKWVDRVALIEQFWAAKGSTHEHSLKIENGSNRNEGKQNQSKPPIMIKE